MGVDNSLRLDDCFKNYKIEVVRLIEDDMEFDMIGIDASIANAFRRILIAEVPKMAIEKVLIENNTSVVQDEALSHRLGLIPIKVDPRMFDYLSENDTANERNTIVLKLDVSCKKGSPRLTVKLEDLNWLPNGSEFLIASSNESAKPQTYTSSVAAKIHCQSVLETPSKHEDISIDRLGSGQAIELEAHAVEGYLEKLMQSGLLWPQRGTECFQRLYYCKKLKMLKQKIL